MAIKQAGSKQKIVPCLWFEKNNAEAAMKFYTSIFPHSRIVLIQRYPKGGEGVMKGMDGKVLTGIFELEKQRFMCLDGGPLWSFTGAISFQVECENQKEVDHYWKALSADPKSEQCGWLKDKYGISWQITPRILGAMLTDSDKKKANRVLQAMLQMKKIDIAGLQKAYEGK